MTNKMGTSSDEAKYFEECFRKYFPRLVRYATRFVENEEQAKDIVQETFLKCWSNQYCMTTGSVSALLFTMVRNSCLNHLKHSKNIHIQRLQQLENIEGSEQLYAFDMRNDVEHQLVSEEFRKQLDEQIEKLPPRCKEVFTMSRFSQMKNKDIAEKLQISQTAVEKHISKALTILNHYFSNYLSSYPILWIIPLLLLKGNNNITY